MKNHTLVFRLPQSEDERREAEALRKLGYETPLILLTPEEFQRLKKLFDGPPKQAGRR